MSGWTIFWAIVLVSMLATIAFDARDIARYLRIRSM